VPVWVAIVSAGPALATFVRHRGWPLKRERPAVVVAVTIGMGLSYGGQLTWDAFADANVAPAVRAAIGGHALKATMPLAAISMVSEFSVFFCVSGGAALLAYFYEHKRWRDVERGREMESQPRRTS
jgi:hypothetical protein